MSSEKRVDRRILKTRQLLQQTFMDIAQEKGFAAISVQEITERANVNRGTFYLHFEDKYRLTESVIREQFQQMLTAALPDPLRWDVNTVYRLILTVLECLEGKYRHTHYPSHILVAVAPLLEQIIQEELTHFILVMLNQDASKPLQSEMLARVISWAIFGPALQWSREAVVMPSDQMANTILRVIMDGIAPVLADE